MEPAVGIGVAPYHSWPIPSHWSHAGPVASTEAHPAPKSTTPASTEPTHSTNPLSFSSTRDLVQEIRSLDDRAIQIGLDSLLDVQ